MPVFPSKEWFDAAIAIANADPEAVKAGLGWVGAIGAVALPEGPLAEPFVIYLRPQDGRLDDLRILSDADELEALAPAYLASAPYSVWKGLLAGTVDPIEAVLRRRLTLQGDLTQVIERARYKDFTQRVLSKVPTSFLDD